MTQFYYVLKKLQECQLTGTTFQNGQCFYAIEHRNRNRPFETVAVFVLYIIVFLPFLDVDLHHLPSSTEGRGVTTHKVFFLLSAKTLSSTTK